MVKRLFFTYRNGSLADTLRRLGDPHRMIFGLEIPRIAEIARGLECEGAERAALAEELWADSGVRESRLLACYLFDPASVGEDRAVELACSTQTQEESDMLAFRLLKRMPSASRVLARLESLADSPSALRTAAILRRHLS